MEEEGEGPNFFTQNKRYILIALTIISFLSLLSSILIISTYIFVKKIRNYAYKLVTYLSFANIILSIGNILSIGTIQNEREDSLCYAQALMVNYGGLASILWTAIIAWSIYSATVLSAKNLREKNCRFLLFGYGIPLLLSIIPLITKQYGRSGFYCWIKRDLTVKDTAMTFVQFYAPLWITLAFNIYAYVKVVRFIRKYISTTLEVRFIHRLKFYPMILVVCWTFATINRIYNIFGHEIIPLTFLHIALGGMQGFLNAIVFGMNGQVRTVWKDTLCCCFNKPLAYARYEGQEGDLKKNEELQQQQEQGENPEEMQPQHGDPNNVSLELAQPRESKSLKDGSKHTKLKLAIRV